MRIKYSPHARKRLKERGVSQAQVRLTLSQADSIFQTDRNRIIARKRLNGKILEVIYTEELKQIVIITLYYL